MSVNIVKKENYKDVYDILNGNQEGDIFEFIHCDPQFIKIVYKYYMHPSYGIVITKGILYTKPAYQAGMNRFINIMKNSQDDRYFVYRESILADKPGEVYRKQLWLLEDNIKEAQRLFVKADNIEIMKQRDKDRAVAMSLADKLTTYMYKLNADNEDIETLVNIFVKYNIYDEAIIYEE